jgi:hypothetical protein
VAHQVSVAITTSKMTDSARMSESHSMACPIGASRRRFGMRCSILPSTSKSEVAGSEQFRPDRGYIDQVIPIQLKYNRMSASAPNPK